MATKNDITGDSISTKQVSDKYRDNYDRIFGKGKETKSNDKNADHQAQENKR